MTIDELKQKGLVKFFGAFIGRSSSGKTTAAASFPKPFHELDFDMRANGIVNAIEQGWLSGDKIDIKQFNSLNGYMQVQDYLNNLSNYVGLGKFPFETIHIGSGTSLVRLLDLTVLNLPKNTSGIGHLDLGGLSMTGPADYKFESQATHRIIDYLRNLPCHGIIDFHLVNNYGKRPGAKETDPPVIIGEKLTLTANLAENILAQFNDVYKFSTQTIGGEDKYYVEFRTEIARNSFGIPPGLFDITKKSFYDFFQALVKDIREGTFKKDRYSIKGNTGGLIV